MTMVKVPEGMAVSTQGQHYVHRKNVMLTKDAPLSSHQAVSFCKLDHFFLLDLASIKTLLACSILGGCERQILLN